MEAAGRVDVAVQTDISLPQRVEAFWHCCPSSVTIVDKGSGTDNRQCNMVDTETVNESEGIFDIHGEAYEEPMNQSASIDPQQRMKQTSRERHVDGPPENVGTEQFIMTPQSDHSLFDFDELETLGQHEVHRPVHERDYRGEDAQERFRLAERRIVQETVMSIDGNDADNDDECPCLDSQISDT